MRSVHRWSVLGFGLLLCGCSVPVATGLEETEANDAIVALQAEGIAASKEPEALEDDSWRVTVLKSEAGAAARVLSEEDLPKRGSPSLLEALGKGGLLPSRASEHAKVLAGTAGELERSLASLDGVVSARVHLAVPTPALFDGLQTKTVSPSASVLIRHRKSASPVPLRDVQRLVAGAVPGLTPDAVQVVSSSVLKHEPSVEQQLARFGPISVSRASLTPLRIGVVATLALNLLLLGCVLLLWSRLRKAQAS